MLGHEVAQVDGVGVVVAGDVLPGPAGAQVVQAALEQQVQGPAGAIVGGVAPTVAVAPAGVIQVGQVELVDALGVHQLQQAGKVGGVLLGQGEAHSHLDALLPAHADAPQGPVEGTVEASEAVVGGPQAVQADAHVVVAHLADGLQVGLLHQGAVGGQPQVEAQGLGPLRHLDDVGAHQGLAAGEDQHRHAEGAQVVHDPAHLGGVQFTLEVDVGGSGIAVLAGQVAAPDQVPDHHRPGGLAVGWGRPVVQGGLQVAGDAEHGVGPPRQAALGDPGAAARRSPVFLRMRRL